MDDILGATLPVFIGVTVALGGFAAWMTGKAIGGTWRPWWQVFFYCCLLGCATRFLIQGLFDGEMFSPSGYLIDVIVLQLVGVAAYRSTLARKMVSQYPWLYGRSGPFGWRELAEHHAAAGQS